MVVVVLIVIRDTAQVECASECQLASGGAWHALVPLPPSLPVRAISQKATCRVPIDIIIISIVVVVVAIASPKDEELVALLTCAMMIFSIISLITFAPNAGARGGRRILSLFKWKGVGGGGRRRR